jgi:plastocyanin
MKTSLSLGLVFGLCALTSAVNAGTLRGKVSLSERSGVPSVIVYVDGIQGEFQPDAVPPEMNHVNLRFDPSVLAVLKGTTVPFPNSDPVFHSAFSISPSNPFDLGIYAQGRQKSVRFVNPGVVEIYCRIHFHMRASILVLENPYHALTDQEGNYVINNIPEGDYSVRAWQSPSKYLTEKVSIRPGNSAVLDFLLKP